MKRFFFALSVCLIGFGCSAVLGINDAKDRSAQPDAAVADAPVDEDAGQTTSSKVDLLFVIDDSSGMANKQAMFAKSIEALLDGLGNDIHIGVISTSLGTPGADVCPDTSSPGLNHHAYLLNHTADGQTLTPPIFEYDGSTSRSAIAETVGSIVTGAGEGGCGLEAQLESAYRFLVQPDPWMSVAVQGGVGTYIGIDNTVLSQRQAFLRPDSLVLVVMLTDEDDSIADPRSVGGQGWGYMNTTFPASIQFGGGGQQTTAPRPTTICSSQPASPDCTSCGFAATCNTADPACQKIQADSNCKNTGGFYTPAEDSLNTRFVRMKRRFGVDPQFPISRYVDGFSSAHIPNRDGEHTISGTVVSDYLGTPNCTNPLFAASLPSSAAGKLCNLPIGPRGKNLVVFALIGGAPAKLLGPTPDWQSLLGQDPDTYDDTGLSPYMLQSLIPRATLAPATDTRGDNGSDAINGREWRTNGGDLEYACTSGRQIPLNCTTTDASCDCADATLNPPLCSANIGQQLRDKGYPAIRELRVAQGLGDRGIAAGSICPAPDVFDYKSAVKVITDRVASRIVAPP